LKELHANSKIINAVKNQLDPPLFGFRKKRELLLSELWALNYLILSIAKKWIPSSFPLISEKLIIRTKTSKIDSLGFMELMRRTCLLTLNGHTNSVLCVCSSGD
jgi:hypothetical protein